MTSDDFMKMALELARKGEGFTSPNPMVGAVVVRDGNVVGKGWHEAAGKAHAEVIAIDDAGHQAAGADLYVTLEPCNHFGRTPPCTEKILSAGIRQVIVAMKDPNPDVKGGGSHYLMGKGVDVTIGVCESEAKRLNEAFIKFITTRRPFVIVKCAATLDGRIATRTGDSRWVSGEESRQYVHRLRHAMDAIMVGIGTIRTDNPQLTARLDDMKTKDPIRVILDTRLSISEHATVLNLKSDAKTIIVVGNGVSEDRKSRILSTGAIIMESESEHGKIALAPLMDKLGAIGITSLLIEGGSRIIGSALRSKIADKVIFCYAPKILGGDDGVPICEGKGAEMMSGCIPVKDIAVHRFGDDVMIEGYVD